MQLVENDRVEVGEKVAAVGVAQQQGELLRRGHEDVGGRVRWR